MARRLASVKLLERKPSQLYVATVALQNDDLLFLLDLSA